MPFSIAMLNYQRVISRPLNYPCVADNRPPWGCQDWPAPAPWTGCLKADHLEKKPIGVSLRSVVFDGFWWFLMVFDGFWWVLYVFCTPKKSVLKTSENIWKLELLLFTGSNFCAIGSELHTSSVMAPGFGRIFFQDPPVEDGAPVGLRDWAFSDIMGSNGDLWALMNNTKLPLIPINSH